MLQFILLLSLINPLVTSQSNEDSDTCAGQTIVNYIYGHDSVPLGPAVNPNNRTRGRPGKSGPPGPRGEKGSKGKNGVPDNSELETLNRELAKVKQKLEEQTLPRTCDYIDGEEGDSGEYLISPFPGLIQPFFVHCNFDGVSSPQTVFNHDALNEMSTGSCEPNFCHKRKIRYKASLKQIVAAMNLSVQCQQFVKLRCISMLFNHRSGKRANQWISRNGEPRHYWGGAVSRRRGYCACGETGTCVGATLKCNCDTNKPPETSDEGFLTDKDSLPVTELQFGDTGDNGEQGWHTLGPLVCSGRQSEGRN